MREAGRCGAGGTERPLQGERVSGDRYGRTMADVMIKCPKTRSSLDRNRHPVGSAQVARRRDDRQRSSLHVMRGVAYLGEGRRIPRFVTPPLLVFGDSCDGAHRRVVLSGPSGVVREPASGGAVAFRATLPAMPSAKTIIKRAVPLRAMRAYRGGRGRWDRNDPLFDVDAQQGPLAALYQRASALPGYFTYDDAVAFTLVMSTQSAAGVKGDVLEIGSYHGRSTAFIAHCIQPAERLIVCDTFEADTEDEYPEPPSPAALRAALSSLAPALSADQLDIRAGRSDALDVEGVSFRFAHIDGGHTHDVALHDLRLVADHLAPGGVIAVDDYVHPVWREVTTAVDQFLEERPDFRVLADVNRWAESGRKLYLVRR